MWEAERREQTRWARAEDFEWQLHARCRGLPTEMFFASDGERGQLRAAREERAKKVCRSCPVKRECLRYAVASAEAWGVWGAMTPRERELIFRGATSRSTTRRQTGMRQDRLAWAIAIRGSRCESGEGGDLDALGDQSVTHRRGDLHGTR